MENLTTTFKATQAQAEKSIAIRLPDLIGDLKEKVQEGRKAASSINILLSEIDGEQFPQLAPKDVGEAKDPVIKQTAIEALVSLNQEVAFLLTQLKHIEARIDRIV